MPTTRKPFEPLQSRLTASGEVEYIVPPHRMEERISVWNIVEQRVVAGNNCPKGRNINQYLRKHPDVVMFTGQTRPSASSLENDRSLKHITLWHRTEKRKISGRAAPLGKHLAQHLGRNPHVEVYTDQDKKEDPSQAKHRKIRRAKTLIPESRSFNVSQPQIESSRDVAIEVPVQTVSSSVSLEEEKPRPQVCDTKSRVRTYISEPRPSSGAHLRRERSMALPIEVLLQKISNNALLQSGPTYTNIGMNLDSMPPKGKEKEDVKLCPSNNMEKQEFHTTLPSGKKTQKLMNVPKYFSPEKQWDYNSDTNSVYSKGNEENTKLQNEDVGISISVASEDKAEKSSVPEIDEIGDGGQAELKLFTETSVLLEDPCYLFTSNLIDSSSASEPGGNYNGMTEKELFDWFNPGINRW